MGWEWDWWMGSETVVAGMVGRATMAIDRARVAAEVHTATWPVSAPSGGRGLGRLDQGDRGPVAILAGPDDTRYDGCPLLSASRADGDPLSGASGPGDPGPPGTVAELGGGRCGLCFGGHRLNVLPSVLASTGFFDKSCYRVQHRGGPLGARELGDGLGCRELGIAQQGASRDAQGASERHQDLDGRGAYAVLPGSHRAR